MKVILFGLTLLLILVMSVIGVGWYRSGLGQLSEVTPPDPCRDQPDWSEAHWQNICHARGYLPGDCEGILAYNWRLGNTDFDPAFALPPGCVRLHF